MTPAETATAELYADLHRYASPSFARDYFLPGFRAHLQALGLPPDNALSGQRILDAGCGGYAAGIVVSMAAGAACARTGAASSTAQQKKRCDADAAERRCMPTSGTRRRAN